MQEHEQLRLAELFASSVGQNMGIIAASALLSFGGVASSPGVPPNHKQIWYNAGIQVGGCGVGGGRVLGSAAARTTAPALNLARHALQIAITLVGDFLGLAIEAKFHKCGEGGGGASDAPAAGHANSPAPPPTAALTGARPG